MDAKETSVLNGFPERRKGKERRGLKHRGGNGNNTYACKKKAGYMDTKEKRLFILTASL